MAAEGAHVAVLDLDGDSAKAVAEEIDGVAVQADVGDADGLRDAVVDAAGQLGGLSLLFNNAGVGSLSYFHEYDPDEWSRVLRVNLNGVYHGFRAAVPIMLAGGGGSIVSTSSISGTARPRARRPTRRPRPRSWR